MPDPTPSTSAPTWYGVIRNYFTTRDIEHMRVQGFDLASYDAVKNHAGEIYQQVAAGNMPPGNPWASVWVANFLQWMTAGFPKGTPPATMPATALRALENATSTARIRKDVTTLKDPELAALKKAFTAIMAKDPTDPNSYFVQAGYHWLPAPNTYCMHHVPGYNPWHRAYLLNFENVLRSVPGCEDVTLPYWDITTPFPEVLKNAPFDKYTLPEDIGPAPYVKGYVTQRNDYPTIEANLAQFGVTADINRALSKTDWEDFNGYFAGAPYNTIIAAHDSGHNSIGPTMSDQSVASFDPVFWFFHCNWDRLFWQWQTTMHATDLNGLISTISQTSDPLSYQTFTDPVVGDLAPFTANPPKVNAAQTVNSVESLGVTYQNPASLTRALVNTTAKTKLRALASEAVAVHTQLVNVRVDGINRLKIPGSFNVHLQKDGKTIASRGFFQPTEVEKCENCVNNAIFHFDFELPLEAVQGGKLSVWVEPLNKEFVGDRFPNKLMGNPTISVNLLLSNE